MHFSLVNGIYHPKKWFVIYLFSSRISISLDFFILLLLLSQTNSSLQNSLAPEIISLGSTKKLKRIARQRDRAFQKHRKSGKTADRKKFLDLKHLFRKSIKLSYQSYLEYMFYVASTDLTSKPNTKNYLHFSNIPNKILPMLPLYTNTILSIGTTPRKPLFLMNSYSLF